jgi:Domain of unknown function (DUF1905)/Bacteriocin-protection, YdeI or OmpD-Associated
MEYLVEKFGSGMHYIRVEESVVELFAAQGHKRVLCSIGGADPFHCAFMPKKEGGYFVNLGAAVRKKHKIAEGSRIEVSFSPDTSEYQFEEPEVFREVLRSDPEAEVIFRSLTPGRQRGLMYLVQSVKSEEQRIARSLKIAAHLKAGISDPRMIK